MKTLVVFLALVLAAGTLFATDPTPGKNLYQLEIIAYDGAHCPSQDGIDTSRHQIAVKADVSDNPNGLSAASLVRQNDIMLSAGEFQVLDGNACADGVARFQLPAQSIVGGTLEDPTFQSYQVYERLVGKPNTGIDVRTCATDDNGTPDDPSDDFITCSTESVVDVRQKGAKPQWDNVSRQLLTICLDTDGNGACDTRVPLFSSEFYDFFWNWNTTGKAHAQLVFVAIPD